MEKLTLHSPSWSAVPSTSWISPSRFLCFFRNFLTMDAFFSWRGSRLSTRAHASSSSSVSERTELMLPTQNRRTLTHRSFFKELFLSRSLFYLLVVLSGQTLCFTKIKKRLKIPVRDSFDDCISFRGYTKLSFIATTFYGTPWGEWVSITWKCLDYKCLDYKCLDHKCLDNKCFDKRIRFPPPPPVFIEILNKNFSREIVNKAKKDEIFKISNRQYYFCS